MSQQSVAGVLLFPCCFTRGYYQLEFRGSFNKKPITGPSVNITVLPDPTKPVSLTVKYDTNTKFPAGGKFPGLYLFIYFFCSPSSCFTEINRFSALQTEGSCVCCVQCSWWPCCPTKEARWRLLTPRLWPCFCGGGERHRTRLHKGWVTAHWFFVCLFICFYFKLLVNLYSSTFQGHWAEV